ncbi:amidase signature enzyme [Sistotremastrum niveocremeum HHB9708]|uniref:amidase n=1 Tax=Sistotremastrum niveocremeum HHB9708 TaxID=1314777 RepID=A0A164VZ41_9AGAM|nr:amidase signature enzyme [Sistotremastrum niveocremeum HHB9708]
MWPFSDSSWKTVASQKTKERDARISKTVTSLDVFKGAEASLQATASEIVQGIQSGKWTAVEVVHAYIRRAAVAQEKTNCLTEILFDDALAQAKALDEEFAATGVLKGAFHGVPVTFKDQYEITGYDATIGYTTWANKPSTYDAHLVRQAKAAGAIIIAKTNVPQTMLSFECANPLWGRTTNPWSSAHTSGGSSGGEGAVLALDGSALGFGSDIGGSLRIPAHFCGIYGFKPGKGRFSTSGAKSSNPGFEAIPSVTGPMARSVGDIELACRTFFGAGDPTAVEACPPVPFRDVKLNPKLRFGYYLSDGYIKASPACQRAVLETVAALRKAGHECVEFEPPTRPAMGIFAGLTSADGYATLLSQLGPDPKEKSLFLVTLGPKFNSFIRWLAIKVVLAIKGDTVFTEGLSNSRVKSVREFWGLAKQRNEFNKAWNVAVWDHHAFDGIIAPVQASPALPHEASTTLSPLAVATFLYNLLDLPVGIVPVTRVDPSKDKVTEEWTNGPGHGSPIFEENLFAKETVYNVEKMKGLPIGIQVVGKKWEDEKVIAMMDVVDKALGPRGFGPGSWKAE